MVHHFLIGCLHCAKVFDEASRRPCLGTCTHSICNQCLISQDTKNCPVCDKEDAFAETVINYQLGSVLSELRNQLTPENFLEVSMHLETIDQGKCSECHSHSKKLRICVNCVKRHKILSSGSEYTWKLELVEENFERSFLKAKSLAICAECALEKHQEHRVISLRSVSGGISGGSLIANGALLEQKLMMESGFGSWQSVVTHFKTTLARFQLRMKLRNESPFEGLSSVKTPEKPEWETVMKTSRDEVKRLHERNERRMNRMLVFEMESLQKYLELTSEAKASEPVHTELRNILEQFPKDLITQDQISEIDVEILETMTLLESRLTSESRLPIDMASEKFFKYKVIISEFKESLEDMKTSEHQMLRKVLELQKSKAAENLMKLEMEKMILEDKKESEDLLKYLLKISKLNTKCYVYKHELVEKQLEVDRFIVKFLEATGRKKMADMMKMKYFPEGPGRRPEDQAYLELMQEFLSENCNDSMKKLF